MSYIPSRTDLCFLSCMARHWLPVWDPMEHSTMMQQSWASSNLLALRQVSEKTWNEFPGKMSTGPHAVMEHRLSTIFRWVSMAMSPAPGKLARTAVFKLVGIVSWCTARQIYRTSARIPRSAVVCTPNASDYAVLVLERTFFGLDILALSQKCQRINSGSEAIIPKIQKSMNGVPSTT